MHSLYVLGSSKHTVKNEFDSQSYRLTLFCSIVFLEKRKRENDRGRAVFLSESLHRLFTAERSRSAVRSVYC